MEIYLTRLKLEEILWRTFVLALDMNPESEAAQAAVRVAWPVDAEVGSNPAWERDENICFLRIFDNTTDPYANLLNVSHDFDLDAQTQTEVVKYTRVHGVNAIFYGPDAVDNAEVVRIRMQREDIRAFLRESSLYPIPGMGRPTRTPELFAGAWWDRCDAAYTFYEGCRREWRQDYLNDFTIGTTKEG